MSDLLLPDLTFPTIACGTHRVPQNLSVFLYRGGAATPIIKVAKLIACGQLGQPLEDRLPLIKKLHSVIASDLAMGKSGDTITNTILAVRSFIGWCDANGRAVTLESAAQDYRAWTEALLHRIRIKKDIKHRTAYGVARYVDYTLSKALDIKRGLRRLTRLKAPKITAHTLGAHTDKQNLADTFAFGHVLLDITAALNVDALFGPLPVEIRLRRGGVLTEWSRLRSPEKVKALQGIGHKHDINETLSLRAVWMADASSRTRSPLVNLRIEAELLIFIAQTGMNLAQAHRLKRGLFRYQTEADDVLVYRAYKGRRGGEVEFRVYKAYRPLFERYLSWLDVIVPQSEDARLFPFSYLGIVPAEGTAPRFKAIRVRCGRIGMPWVGPRALRRTRVNWLLRRSRDPHLTAEMAQHSEETLFSSYLRPHHQVAAVEITRFHRLADPAIAPPGPGVCIELHRTPRSVVNIEPEAPTPDCVSPAGCLFCDFHRDIDRDDYVWSLTSYRYLKSLELSRYAPPEKDAPSHPAAAVINRINAKLSSLEGSSETRRLWVHEAIDRIREGRYHPAWDGFIQCLEVAG